MPRKRELTWQPGTSGRPGRWKKIYLGRAYYFAAGRGKSDHEAYIAAVNEWQQTKQAMQVDVGGQQRSAYEREIAKWEQVLSWSHEHFDETMANIATQKVQGLRAELAKPKLSSIVADQIFDNYFNPDIRFPDLMRAIREVGKSLKRRFNFQTSSDEEKKLALDSISRHLKHGDSDWLSKPIVPEAWTPDFFEKLEIEREIWRDRLEVKQRSAPANDKTIAAQIEMFLNTKTKEAGANSVSTTRLYSLRLHLTGFANWIGECTAVKQISSTVIINYRLHLLEKVANDEFARTTANDRLCSIKGFVRWLWQTEAIETLPRVLQPRTKILEIGTSKAQIQTCTEGEITRLLQNASACTRLFILLTLNTAMTQKDISDLTCDEVDWKQGRIKRRRSKTRQCENVPMVSYQLWPETKELLILLRSNDRVGRVLLNRRGEPLLTEKFDAARKYKKTDNIRSAFERLRKKVGIDKPFKSLKKTSASHLRENAQFHSIVGLFLGHAPREVSDRHYAAAPQKLLDDAIGWLHGFYSGNRCFSTPVDEQSPSVDGDNCTV